MRDAQAGVFDFAGFFTKDRPQQALLGGQLGLALGRDLADQDVARLDFGADADDAVLVEVAQRVLADVRNVARDLFGPQLGVARLDLVLFDVNRGEGVVADQLLAEQDGVFEVAALPAHEGHQHVLTKRQLARVGRRRVCQWLAVTDLLAAYDDGPLREAGALVGADVFPQAPDVEAARFVAHHDLLAGDAFDDAIDGRQGHLARVARRALLHARADQRRRRL